MTNTVKCLDCGCEGAPIRKASGRIYVGGPFYLLLGLVCIAAPVIFIPWVALGYFLFVKKACEKCHSENIVSLGDGTSQPVNEDLGTAVRRLSADGATALADMHAKSAAARDHRRDFKRSLVERSLIEPIPVEVVGGSGWESLSGRKVVLTHDRQEIYITDLKEESESHMSIDDLRDVQISGPGRVVSGGGISGGGFGVEGAAVGLAAATVLNLLTTRTDIKTFVHLQTSGTELILMSSELEPDAVRLRLSSIFVGLRSRPTTGGASSLSEEIGKLHKLFAEGALTDEEFQKAKSKLLDR